MIRHEVDLPQEFPPLFRHHDQLRRKPRDLAHHLPLFEGCSFKTVMTGGHHGDAQQTQQIEQPCAGRSAVDAVFVLQADTEHRCD
jgi:hypothetical protein